MINSGIDLNVLKFLLNNGAPANVANKEGDTPLHYLASCNHREAIKLLLAKGGDKNAKNHKGELPLHKTDGRYRNTLLDLLKPDNVEESTDEQGRTLLHLACGNRDITWGGTDLKRCLESLRKALNETKKPMVADKGGRTPLHYAANIGFHEAIKELPLDSKNVNAVDEEGNTALYHAVWALLSDQYNHGNGIGVTDTDLPGLKEIVSVLSTPGKRFMVEEHFAKLSYMRKRLAINALLDADADPKIQNNKGESSITHCQTWLKMFGSNYRLRETKII